MKRSTKLFLYGLYTLALVMVFLYLRFPTDTARDIVLRQLQQLSPQLRVETSSVKPTFPPGLKLTPLKVDYDQITIFRSDYLKVVPDVLSLLKSQKSVNFSGTLGSGSIQGRAVLNTNGRRSQESLVLNLKTIPLASLDIFKQWPSVKPSGDLNAFLDYDQSKGGSGATAKVNLDVAPARIAFDPPLMGLGQMEFNQIQAEMTVTPRMLQITHMEAVGPQLESRISGSILFRVPLSSSRVTLSCTLKPQPAFVAEHKNDMLSGIFSSALAQTRGIVVRISGTLDNPRYAIR